MVDPLISTSGASAGESLLIRPVNAEDSFESLTELLHRAYARLKAMGFRYLATHQDVATTRSRAANGECYLGLLSDRVIGNVLVIPPRGASTRCAWYARHDVAILSQFGVEPEFQRRGYGARLLAFAESRAWELGAQEVAVDTAESAQHLVDYYRARGYRLVDSAQFEHTNYRSVVLSKARHG